MDIHIFGPRAPLCFPVYQTPLFLDTCCTTPSPLHLRFCTYTNDARLRDTEVNRFRLRDSSSKRRHYYDFATEALENRPFHFEVDDCFHPSVRYTSIPSSIFDIYVFYSTWMAAILKRTFFRAARSRLLVIFFSFISLSLSFSFYYSPLQTSSESYSSLSLPFLFPLVLSRNGLSSRLFRNDILLSKKVFAVFR